MHLIYIYEKQVSDDLNMSIKNIIQSHSDLRDYISDTTRSFRRMHAWRLNRFISR